MVAGAIISAVGSYLFQLIGGRALGDVEFAPIAILWTLQFLGFTILFTPVEQLIIRRLVLSGGDMEAVRSVRATIALVIAGAAAAVAVYVGVTLDDFQDDTTFVLIAVLLFISLGTYAVGRGILAGRRQFRAYGLAVTAEAVSRIIFAVAMLFLLDSAVGLGWALAAAPMAFLLAWRFRTPEAATLGRADETSAHRFLGGLLVMTTASQTILAAGTLVVAGLGAPKSAVSVFHVTFTLFRGPLTASYNVLARLLPGFTDRASRGEDRVLVASTLQIAGVGLVLAALGALAGAAVGPSVVSLMFGSEFRPDPELAGLAAGGVVLAGAALFISQILVARGTTNVLALAWAFALVVAAVVVAAGATLSPSNRVAIGFVAGEATALVGSVLAVVRPGIGKPRRA